MFMQRAPIARRIDGLMCCVNALVIRKYSCFTTVLLIKKPLYISKGIDINDSEIQTSSRIGIANSGEAAHYPWRFFLKDNPYVSNYRK